MKKYILSIETSCDDTSIAIVDIKKKKLILQKHQSQLSHSKYGGVVPEVASREHVLLLQKLFDEICREIDIYDIALIAVTKGPGLIGSLITGVCFAKGLSVALNVKIIGVNHLQGHLMSASIDYKLKFPLLFLLVSGGHSQIIFSEDIDKYTLLGKTLDDSTGEVFDKVAKYLNLGYPGGPVIEKIAEDVEFFYLRKISIIDNFLTDEIQKEENPECKNFLKYVYKKYFIEVNDFSFKASLENDKTYNLSFSGLKTQIKNFIEDKKSKNQLNAQMISDICYESQKSIIKTLVNKVVLCLEYFKNETKNFKHRKQLIVCGGVSANKKLKNILSIVANKNKLDLIAPPLKYATDNAFMIALMGIEKYNRGMIDDLRFDIKSKMDISEL